MARVERRRADSREDEYRKKRQEYADLAASPQRLATATASVRAVRPDIAKSLDGKLAEIVKYVNDKAPPSFAGAVGRGFSLEAAADRSVVQLGDPITLTLTIRGDGNLGNVALPALEGEHGFSPERFRRRHRKAQRQCQERESDDEPRRS